MRIARRAIPHFGSSLETVEPRRSTDRRRSEPWHPDRDSGLDRGIGPIRHLPLLEPRSEHDFSSLFDTILRSIHFEH